MAEQMVVERRFRGPPASGNGGYTCGLVAAFVGGPAEVTLRSPPPLDRPLDVLREGRRVQVRDGETLVAEAGPAELDLAVPAPPSYEEAEEASRDYPGFFEHAFPECFVCGPARATGDGLRIFGGPAGDRVAAPWRPDAWLAGADGRVRPEFVWSALDCPGAFAVNALERGEALLGRLAATVLAQPRPGERCVVIGWQLAPHDRRKRFAGTAVYGEDAGLCGYGRAVWITPA